MDNLKNVLSPELTEQIIKLQAVLTPTGDLEADKARAKQYADIVGMDSANAKMMEVMTTRGSQAAAKEMIREFTDEEGKVDYAAMRSRYG